ncbi:MAG TPA: M1 family aminopeptidase [Ignavibacteriaceae bacterium]|nr:M1 family aminopeptidase [Ignavibacteriaceae bacterium]
MPFKKNSIFFNIVISFYVTLLCMILGFTIIKTKNEVKADTRHSQNFRNLVDTDYIKSSQFKIDILHYGLNIELNIIKKTIKGEAIITGVLLNPELKSIDLNFYDNMKISEVTLNNNKADFQQKNTSLSISLNNNIIDTFIVKIIYEGTPKRAGLSAFTFGKVNGKDVVYNLNEPNYASTWFPCNDIPTDKAMLDISIKNDSAFTSISNGKLIDVVSNGNKKLFHWKTFYPISTYLICVYSSIYKNFNEKYISLDGKDTMDVEYYALPSQYKETQKDFEGHPQMIKVLSELFGEYPFIKEKYGVAEFLWNYGAMEHQTITGIGEAFVSGDRMFTDVYVHELAHHWWGNAVGPATWDDIWLNEGFATYSEALYDEKLYGEKAYIAKMMSGFEEFQGTLFKPGEDLFSSKVYQKGCWVLHMLRWEVGDENFFKILRQYFETYKYKNASTDNFIALSEKISGQDLKKFFDQWVYTGDVIPKVIYSYEYDGKNKLIIHMKQVQKSNKVFKLKIEVEISFADGSNETKLFEIEDIENSFVIETKKKPIEMNVDPKNRLLVDFEPLEK